MSLDCLQEITQITITLLVLQSKIIVRPLHFVVHVILIVAVSTFFTFAHFVNNRTIKAIAVESIK